jgi:hypothetical protein
MPKPVHARGSVPLREKAGPARMCSQAVAMPAQVASAGGECTDHAFRDSTNPAQAESDFKEPTAAAGMLQTEQIVSFAQGAAYIKTRTGKKLHTSALWRWARKGVRGVKLECIRVGGEFMTSIEAIGRFTAALANVEPAVRAGRDVATQPSNKTSVAAKSSSLPAHRAQAIERAERILSDAGI